jgi:hypothetical protein
MKTFRQLVFLIALILLSCAGWAQLEVGGSYTHLTGNSGLDGVTGSAGWRWNQYVTLVGEANFLWDTSRIGVFDLSSDTGVIRIKSDYQSYLGGARVNLRRVLKQKELEKRKIIPHAQLLLGVSHLHQKVLNALGTSLDASDSAFTWVLGGGVDYALSPHWVSRGDLDFVRTHFVDAGQSRLKVSIGLSYKF